MKKSLPCGSSKFETLVGVALVHHERGADASQAKSLTVLYSNSGVLRKPD
jgi:hypothetical protein